MDNPQFNPKGLLVKNVIGLDLAIVGLLTLLLWTFHALNPVTLGFYLCVAAVLLLAVGLFFSPNSTGAITPNPRVPGMQFIQSAFSRQYHTPFNAAHGSLPGWMVRVIAFWSGCTLLIPGGLLVYFWFP